MDPVGPLVYSVTVAFFIAACTGAASTLGAFTIPDCNSFADFVTGCDDTVSSIIAYGILGTIPGAHPMVNSVMSIIGITNRTIIIWSIFRLIRGGG